MLIGGQNIPAKSGQNLSALTKAAQAHSDPAYAIKQEIENAGIDTSRLMANGKERFSWLTWGNESSINDFVHCEVVILVGLLHLPDTHLAALIQGQLNGECTKITHETLDEIQVGEISHTVYQAISRGACRGSEDGQARPMNVYLFHNKDDLEDKLRARMPGLKWKEWTPMLQTISSSMGKKAYLEFSILSYLESLSPETTKLKTSELASAIGLDKVAPSMRRSFQRALQVISESGKWCRQGHCLVRATP